MTNNYPILAYDNWLASATFTFVSGTDNTAAPFSYVANNDISSPALPTSDGELLTVEISIPEGSNQIKCQNGDVLLQEDYGELRLESDAGSKAFVTGAARYDSIGHKTAIGSFSIDYWDGSAWVQIKSQTALSDVDESTIYKLDDHQIVSFSGVYKYRLNYTGLAADSTVSIPELFLGPVLEMPPVDFGYDEYNDVTSLDKFVSASGRTYQTAHYTRIEAKPQWSVIERSIYDESIMEFRDEIMEHAIQFWWAWQPDASPNSCYLMISNVANSPFPIKSPVHRSFSLDMVEAL